ncbi:OFA family MFS transporter [Brevibacterium sp. 91QC2O2]|uniref:OFA family MFS transporter n=1 Tax=Brevibacterium TaxID=1696 RepID=UPI00211BF9BC|nr:MULTISPECIES: OFA family MFS transporter [unclassified Brevibacterium]MCQ9367129.1 OFA family MFS transporter [Brevibacterium sp. 91QC2O2]MCQ9385424.1 OFA family MFS transporter [Brevibacterium sp. 68QC2CO]
MHSTSPLTRSRPGILDREAIVAPLRFNRWLIPAAVLAIHLCIGQVYALSVFKAPFMDRFAAGEVAVGWVFSVAIAMLGISAAIGGTWVERAGPRKAMVVAGVFWVVGFGVATLGIVTGQLWLLYLGYGVIGGIGLGIGYISPVSTLMKWFPDRPGLATGLAIMGFGGGALIASPLSNSLMSIFGGGGAPEQLAAGAAPTFGTLALIYAVAIAVGAFVIRLPHPDWHPEHWDPARVAAHKVATTGQVSVSRAMRTPQFWFLWIVLFTNVTAGIGILENAAPMVQGFFSQITPAAAAGFVGLLSIANMVGRFVWSTASDYMGRRNAYTLYLGAGILMYLCVALFGGANIVLFVAASMLILSFYGGGFAAAPAYLKDLFGTYQVGAIHGRLLTAWSAAGVVGPLIVNTVIESRTRAGATGPAVYTLSMGIMVGLLAVGFVANLLIGKVADKYRAEPAEVEAALVHESNASGGDSPMLSTGGFYHVAAYALTGVVIVGLLYALVQTVIKASALFV